MAPFGTLIRQELFSFWSGILIIIFSLLSLSSLQFLFNYRLLQSAFLQGYPPPAIGSLFLSLFIGSFIAASPFLFALTMTNALLTGVNIVLLGKAILYLRGNGKVHVSLGGATLFSLASAGCLSCGFSLLSLIGISASFAFLPFSGILLRVISILLLLFSAFYMLRKLHNARYCRL